MKLKLADSPAYPVPLGKYENWAGVQYTGGHPGMTLRQYYAGLAMQGLLSNENFTKAVYRADIGQTLSELAVSQADGLLAALEK